MQHSFNQHITDGDDAAAYEYGSIRMSVRASVLALCSSQSVCTLPLPVSKKHSI
jgi:hypothetical protein